LQIDPKGVIQKVIAETKFAFFDGRQPMDDILIVNDLVEEAKGRKKEVLLFKVDFEEAYYSVDWKYLDYVMEGMGFNVKWIKWIQNTFNQVSC
jgi:hypothetical protein